MPWEKKMATHSSILAWEIPWTEEPGGLQSQGHKRVRPSAVSKQQHQPQAALALLPGALPGPRGLCSACPSASGRRETPGVPHRFAPGWVRVALPASFLMNVLPPGDLVWPWQVCTCLAGPLNSGLFSTSFDLRGRPGPVLDFFLLKGENPREDEIAETWTQTYFVKSFELSPASPFPPHCPLSFHSSFPASNVPSAVFIMQIYSWIPFFSIRRMWVRWV